MALKPWYKVVTPREDRRSGKPLDAAEFAVHLDQVRDERLGARSPTHRKRKPNHPPARQHDHGGPDRAHTSRGT